MDYRKAYEELSKAVWQYDKIHNDAYVRLMLVVREIDDKLKEPPAPPIYLSPNDDPNK